jgi:hypothetical protein
LTLNEEKKDLVVIGSQHHYFRPRKYLKKCWHILLLSLSNPQKVTSRTIYKGKQRKINLHNLLHDEIIDFWLFSQFCEIFALSLSIHKYKPLDHIWFWVLKFGHCFFLLKYSYK